MPGVEGPEGEKVQGRGRGPGGALWAVVAWEGGEVELFRGFSCLSPTTRSCDGAGGSSVAIRKPTPRLMDRLTADCVTGSP